MPFVVPVNSTSLFKGMVALLLIDLFSFIFTGQAFEQRQWRWFAWLLLFTVFMFAVTIAQARFICRVTKDR